MSYIGQNLPSNSFIGYTTDTFAGDGSTTAFTMSKAPFSESAVIVVINNVIQKPTTNFTISGTTLTIVGTAVASGDVIYATHTGGAIPINTASALNLNGASDQLILDADADTTISADTDDQIDIKIAGADDFQFTANTFTAATGSTIVTPTITYAAGGSNSQLQAETWRVTTAASLGNSSNVITANWEIADDTPQIGMNVGMSQSSGIFTFPSTGYYFILWSPYLLGDAASTFAGALIHTTINNSDYDTNTIERYASIAAASHHAAPTSHLIFDVTNTTNCKVKFDAYVSGTGVDIGGSSSGTRTAAQFIRLGDT